ncbi:hypothetical protein [Vandammella animalimorsus]|uniref:hypothetical protein n=1 Tax=Vandammella animalimorsus TaxID=2029117 RepID=UPI001177A72D|nr:hypothetical protein [Vandammella animalimorsus]
MSVLGTLLQRWHWLPSRARRFVVANFVCGLVIAVGYSIFPLRPDCTGCALIPADEGWRRGLTWPYIGGGVLLMWIALAVLWGWTCLRWAVLFWYPVFFGLAYQNGVWRGAWSSGPADWMMLAFISVILLAAVFKPVRDFPDTPDSSTHARRRNKPASDSDSAEP